MNHFLKSIFFSACAAIALVALSSAMITTDFYLKLDNGKGVTKIIHSTDRESVVSNLPSGIYMFSVCDEKGNDLPVTAQFEYSVQSRPSSNETPSETEEFIPIKIEEHYTKSATSNLISIPANGSALDCKAIVLPHDLEK